MQAADRNHPDRSPGGGRVFEGEKQILSVNRRKLQLSGSSARATRARNVDSARNQKTSRQESRPETLVDGEVPRRHIRTDFRLPAKVHAKERGGFEVRFHFGRDELSPTRRIAGCVGRGTQGLLSRNGPGFGILPG